MRDWHVIQRPHPGWANVLCCDPRYCFLVLHVLASLTSGTDPHLQLRLESYPDLTFPSPRKCGTKRGAETINLERME
jgi:hypothetical protein